MLCFGKWEAVRIHKLFEYMGNNFKNTTVEAFSVLDQKKHITMYTWLRSAAHS